MFRTFLLAGTALVALHLGAHAADLPARTAPYLTAPVYSWTGAYFGAAVGYGSLSTDFHDVDDNFDNQSVNGHRKGGVFGGLYTGYNWQTGNAVLGLEIAGNGFSSTKISVNPYGDDGYLQSRLNWTASAKARAGLAIGNAMVYIAAGPAIAGIKGNSFTGEDTYGSSSKTRFGVAVAGGVEHAITPNILVRLQAEYTAFEKQNWADTDQQRFGQTNSVATVSLGVAYKFGDGR